MLDVAAVAEVLWDCALGPASRAGLAQSLGLDESAARAWVSHLVGLHDLGKVSPAFARQQPDLASRMADLGLPCPAFAGADRDHLHHGAVTAWGLPGLLQARGVAGRVAANLATSVGGHHGTFPHSGSTKSPETVQVGGPPWEAVRAALERTVAALLSVDGITPPERADYTGLMHLAGLASVADWIGSSTTYFQYAATLGTLGSEPADLPAYLEHARRQAEVALRELGWTAPPWDGEPRAFEQLFPNFTPEPMQKAVQDLAAQLDGPALVVLEAPMGEGKTEAALSLVDSWGARAGIRGAYVALPTQATSNQMFRRVREFLARRFADGRVELQLLHGHAALSTEFAAQLQLSRLLDVQDVCGDPGFDGAPANVVASEWFTARKRGVLAPWGVGTVDQALLAALESKHVFVRLFGLAGKAVVVDEVHAYDVYMSAILERLLEWLGALRSPVVLLSATLPSGSRDALARAYARGAGWAEPRADATPYPRATWVASESAGARLLATSSRGAKRLNVRWFEGDDEALALALKERLAGGGCAAVICNTVARAQQVYQLLHPHFPGIAEDSEPELDLLHARFLFEERERREERALRRYGKPAADGTAPGRPARSILVATQVVEQSLDLDFDLMVSESAPADLLLQRAGRLHRHLGRVRPPGLDDPWLWIRAPETDPRGVPEFDKGTAAVYDGHVLLRSWLALRDRATVLVPEDVQALVDAVYEEVPCPVEAPAIHARWEETLEKLRDQRRKYRDKARGRCLEGPAYAEAFWKYTRDPREEEAPDRHEEHQALTRPGEQSVTLVLLREGESDAADRVEDARRLLRRSVPVSHRAVVRWLTAQPVPPVWTRSPLLRHCRLLCLDREGRAPAGDGWTFRLDAELGLVVEDAGAPGGRRIADEAPAEDPATDSEA